MLLFFLAAVGGLFLVFCADCGCEFLTSGVPKPVLWFRRRRCRSGLWCFAVKPAGNKSCYCFGTFVWLSVGWRLSSGRVACVFLHFGFDCKRGTSVQAKEKATKASTPNVLPADDLFLGRLPGFGLC